MIRNLGRMVGTIVKTCQSLCLVRKLKSTGFWKGKFSMCVSVQCQPFCDCTTPPRYRPAPHTPSSARWMARGQRSVCGLSRLQPPALALSSSLSCPTSSPLTHAVHTTTKCSLLCSPRLMVSTAASRGGLSHLYLSPSS